MSPLVPEIRDGDRNIKIRHCAHILHPAGKDLVQAIKNILNPTMSELAETFVWWTTLSLMNLQCSSNKVKRHLKTYGAESWTVRFHIHFADHWSQWITIWVSMPSQYKNEPFLIQIMTKDEKWVMYYNMQHQCIVCQPSDCFTHVKIRTWSQGFIKSMVQSTGNNWLECPATNQIINVAIYCFQLDRHWS